jgi:hypothetical protein
MFIIIEMQTNNNSTAVVTPIPTATQENIALQKYYTALAAAAVSNVQLHTVTLLNEEGEVIRTEKFDRREIEVEN